VEQVIFECGLDNWIAKYCLLRLTKGGVFGVTGSVFLLNNTNKPVISEIDVLATRICRNCQCRTFEGCTLKVDSVCPFGKRVEINDLPDNIQTIFSGINAFNDEEFKTEKD